MFNSIHNSKRKRIDRRIIFKITVYHSWTWIPKTVDSSYFHYSLDFQTNHSSFQACCACVPFMVFVSSFGTIHGFSMFICFLCLLSLMDCLLLILPRSLLHQICSSISSTTKTKLWLAFLKSSELFNPICGDVFP